MPRVAFAVLFVFLLGARVIAPTPRAMRPPFSAPASALIPPPSRTAPAARPSPRPPRRTIRPARPPKRRFDPPMRDEPPLTSLVPSIGSPPAAPLEDAPPIAPSRFQLDLVPPLPPLARQPGAVNALRAALVAARRPGPLVPLYGSFATLQALDYHSTRRALATGSAREANPLMRSIVKSPPAFIAVKTAATAAVIVTAEKMWKKNRVGAVLFVAGANAAMGAVVARNYR